MKARPVLDTRYQSKDKTFPVIVRVNHLRQRREFATGWNIEEKYWTGNDVLGKHPKAAIINGRINELIRQANDFLAQCQLDGRPIDLTLIGTGKITHSFTAYLQERQKHYRDKDMIIMARKVGRFLVELKDCFGGEVYFQNVTQDALRKYETYLITAGNGDSTRHKKFKFLRQFYQGAIQEGRAQEPNPFKTYKISTKPVKKEKLSHEQLKAIEDIKLKPGPVNDARNLFLFSYYAKGARFENVVTLRKDQIVKGRIIFKTNKGQKHISVKIHDRLRAIIDQYSGVEGPYLFPLVKSLPTDREGYINAIGTLNATTNRYLKRLAALAGIKIKLTFHVARHTFAWHLKHVTDTIHAIKDALGHSDTKTTEIYLQSLDDEVLDKEMEKLYGV